MPPVHILGIGNLGKFLAHSLRKYHPTAPITLLFHRRSLAEEWEQAGQCIGIERNGVMDRVGGFDVEFIDSNVGKTTVSGEIENLIVATKTHKTVEALRSLEGRVGRSSTLLFLQNGIGTIDEVNKHVFSDPLSRPNYLSGIFNHGVYATSQFTSVHAGQANAFIGPSFQGLVDILSSCSTSRSVKPLPTRQHDPSTPSIRSSYLTQALLDCPELAASLVTAQSLLHIQLQKLAVNAVINPLTALFNCRNGVLFESPRLRPLVDVLLAEISQVLLGIVGAVASSQGNANPDDVQAARDKFAYPALQKQVYDVGALTARNSSSMRQDVVAGRKTEIEYINGFVGRAAEALELECPVNARVVGMVREGVVGVREEDIGERFGVS